MRGVWTALITPFNEKNEIDLPAFRAILKEQVAAGISGVIPCGTTGESPTLSIQEKKILICTAVEELKNTPTQVVAGTGSNNTEESIEFSVWAAQQGVAGVMLVTPYYNKPSQKGLEAHFKKIADALPCEVIIYNVPGRTGISLTPETIVNLASHERIKTLKEATGNVSFTSEILDLLSHQNRHLDILSGDDATFLPLLSIGACGVISVVSNLIPRVMVSLLKAMEKGRPSDALQIHLKYYPLFRDLFIESNPVPIKHAMAFAGWCDERLRLPLVPLSATHLEQIKSSMIRCGISPGPRL